MTYYSPILIPMFILVLDSHLNIINAYCQLFCWSCLNHIFIGWSSLCILTSLHILTFCFAFGVGDGSTRFHMSVCVCLTFQYPLLCSIGPQMCSSYFAQNWVFPSGVSLKEYYLCSTSTQVLLQGLGQSLRRKIIL